MPADGATGPRRPAGRYGPERTRPRPRLALAAAVAAVLLAVGWFAYVAFGPGDPGVHVLDIGYRVSGDATVEVTFEVQKDPDATAVCRVRALNRGFAEVGLADVLVGPTDQGATTRTVVVTTSERAVSANVKACALQ